MKKDIFFQLSQNAAERLAERFGTPLLVLSLEQIEKNYRFLKKHLPRVQLYYAIKANPHQRILELLRDLGSCFDVASDGEMFFGGHRGYNSFYPNKQDEQVFSSPVVITDIKVFNQSWTALSGEERSEISNLSPRFTDKIVLNYKRNNFSIEFSALEYANPERNQYAYRLDGFDAGWQHTDASKRFAYYNNLKSGTYTFYVKSSNSNGIWDENVQTVKVVILPPPWKTWWAYTLYIIILVIQKLLFPCFLLLFLVH